MKWISGFEPSRFGDVQLSAAESSGIRPSILVSKSKDGSSD
jgi:hypothetical protein